MAVMLGKLYSALIAAGADPQSAREAAEELATYDAAIAGIRSDLNLLKWMIGFNLALTLAILWRVFV